MLEGAAADAAVAGDSRATISRRDLSRSHRGFEQVSGAVGELATGAFEALLEEDPDAALALLADLTGATDERLRRLARRLASRVVVDVAAGAGHNRGRLVGRLATRRLPETGGDLDFDASLGSVVEARARGSAVDARELRGRLWSRPRTAWCLLVDRSGSMGGSRLATAAVAAACVALRVPSDHSVVAFSDRALVVHPQLATRPVDAVVGDLLALRGHGTTDLALALRTARSQLARSDAQHRRTVLLSDCRRTTGDDPVTAATGLEDLVVIAPHDDCEEAEAFAASTGARFTTVDGPASVPDAFREVLDQQQTLPP